MSDIRIEKVGKRFGKVTALDNVSLDIAAGELVVLLGPSGCGKTTLLRILAGLEQATTGAVVVGGEDVTARPPHKRNVGMVFQSYALYPHMTVAGNIAFGLRNAGYHKAKIDARIVDTAKMLQIEELLARKPAELSGGQRQRVAIARAIARNPAVLLMDEPLSNLDAALRNHTRVELKKLHRDLGTTMVYVTHDQTEAMTLADRIVVMDKGCVQQIATPQDIYDRPENTFVARFIGQPPMNLIRPGKIADQLFANKPESWALAGVRPEHLACDVENSGGPVMATVEATEYLGADMLVHLQTVCEQKLVCRMAAERPIKTGQNCTLSTRGGQPGFYDKNGNRV